MDDAGLVVTAESVDPDNATDPEELDEAAGSRGGIPEVVASSTMVVGLFFAVGMVAFGAVVEVVTVVLTVLVVAAGANGVEIVASIAVVVATVVVVASVVVVAATVVVVAAFVVVDDIVVLVVSVVAVVVGAAVPPVVPIGNDKELRMNPESDSLVDLCGAEIGSSTTTGEGAGAAGAVTATETVTGAGVGTRACTGAGADAGVAAGAVVRRTEKESTSISPTLSILFGFFENEASAPPEPVKTA